MKNDFAYFALSSTASPSLTSKENNKSSEARIIACDKTKTQNNEENIEWYYT
jgi:hypothetical protein